jgi:hypothetical protein
MRAAWLTEYCFGRQPNPLSLRCTGCCPLDQRKHLHENAGVNLDRGPCVSDLHLTGRIDDWCVFKQDLLEFTKSMNDAFSVGQSSEGGNVKSIRQI